jgi:voltage-gated potassium channel
MEPMTTKSPDLPNESRFERWIDRAVGRATTPRGAVVVIAVSSIAVTAGSALLMTVVDHERYPSLGSGLWWAIQTTTTVGYGDNVPETVAGRLVAALVMLFGIGFLTVITAAITSTFVARSRLELTTSDDQAITAEELHQFDSRFARIEAALASHGEPPTADQLRELDRRLERIEAAVTSRS